MNEAVAPSRKFVPLMVSVNAAPPATAVFGERLVMVGTGGLTVRGTGPDTAPPGFVTVTGIAPGRVSRLAGTCAVSCVVLPKVVASAASPRLTVEPDTKFVPVTVSVNAGPPCVAVDGEIDVIVGLGAVIVSVTELDEMHLEEARQQFNICFI